jgi:hypothetical protein
MAGTAQAGWFGLTEDHPYKNPSPDRDLFVSGGIYKCTKDIEGKPQYNLSGHHIAFICTCQAENMANIVTQKELDYAFENGKLSDESTRKSTTIFKECFQQLLIKFK